MDDFMDDLRRKTCEAYKIPVELLNCDEHELQFNIFMGSFASAGIDLSSHPDCTYLGGKVIVNPNWCRHG